MVLPYEYWPSLSWVQKVIDAEEWRLEHWGSYQKQSLANRCKIAGANGGITLSVPLVSGREQKTLLQNVQIDNTQRWPVQHLRTIKSCYGKAPFFDHYFPSIQTLLLQPYTYLVELDDTIIRQVLRWLKRKPDIKKTERFEQDNSFDAHTIFAMIPYIQVFTDKTGFLTHLSIIDALFCIGPQVTNYLKP